MLAIGRALLGNPRLLIMDEPSEGLAPAIVDTLIDTFQKLEQDGLALLLIEQNLGVAVSLAKRQLVMVGGEIVDETTADVLERTSSCSAATSASNHWPRTSLMTAGRPGALPDGPWSTSVSSSSPSPC